MLGSELLTASNGIGKPIHNQIVPIWNHILAHGLQEDTGKSLIAKYPIPANISLLAPPKVNREVAMAVGENAIKRDTRLVNVQAMMGAASAALGQLITVLLENPTETPHDLLIQLASDAARLIAGVHHQQSQARRLVFKGYLNNQLAETLSETSSDGWLFGENLTDRIQSAKALDRTAAQMKKVVSSSKLKKPSASTVSVRPPLNLHGLSRPPLRASQQDRPRASKVTRSLASKRLDVTHLPTTETQITGSNINSKSLRWPSF